MASLSLYTYGSAFSIVDLEKLITALRIHFVLNKHANIEKQFTHKRTYARVLLSFVVFFRFVEFTPIDDRNSQAMMVISKVSTRRKPDYWKK